MGIIAVALVDEDGNIQQEVEGDTHELDALLRAVSKESGICVRFIDQYADTVFNSLQMEPFLSEWSEVEDMAPLGKPKDIATVVRSLAQKCRAAPHLYLKFFGD
jgi:hypothetical protein